MKIIFLMGGNKIKLCGEQYPLYLTEVGGKSILERQIQRVQPLACEQVIFCIREEEIRNYRLDFIIKQIIPDAVCITVSGDTKGAVCTALLAGEYLNNGDEVLLLAIDDFIDEPVSNIISFFRKKNCSAGIVSFPSLHPRYSFARVDKSGMVIETSETQPVSNKALASFYYFTNGVQFLECAKDVIRKDRMVNGFFYLSQVVNEIILRQERVAIFDVSRESYHALKNEAHLARYISEFRETGGGG
jgi:NDP-sugar pyrophosphorylase family protein